jgi:hypothetical protein
MLTVVRHRWWAAVIGTVLVVAASWGLAHPAPVYWAQQDVLFMLPQNDGKLNAYTSQTDGLIATAGLIAKDVTGSASGAMTVSDGVTLVGQGIHRGYSVRLPNSGGQWANNYDRAVLDVQVADTSDSAVRLRMAALYSEISAALTHREGVANVSQVNRIRLRLNPGAVRVHYESGHRAQALGAALVLGVGMVLALVIWWEGRQTLSPRRGSRPRTSVGAFS